jgi:hypothetical protein
MNKINTLDSLRKCFEKLLPKKDSRTNISPLEFVVSFVFCYLGDSKDFSLEAIRREMKSNLDQDISRSAFWERLSRKRLKNFLSKVVGELMINLATSVSVGSHIASRLGVTDILLVDSSTITLKDGAKNKYPGTGSAAGIKWHACFSLMTGLMKWFQLTPSSTHDRQCIPDIKQLVGKLIIVDLGYYDFGLFFKIQEAGGFFLSRLKSNAVVYVKEIVQGLSEEHVGRSLLSINFNKKMGTIIEVIIEKVHDQDTLVCRAVGFWNPSEKRYHWYMTNLTALASLIYPLYRLRWQIELIFKACKNSLNANQITSEDGNIIESLLLASIAAHLSSHTLFEAAVNELDECQTMAISFQRISKVAVVLSQYFVRFLLNPSKHTEPLIRKIKLFVNELFDPNYKNRETSLMRVHALLDNT